MTLEDLKIEAKAHGYRLMKCEKSTKLLPCPACGKKCTSEWSGPNGWYRKCNYCDLQGGLAPTRKQAKIEWNRTVETYDKRVKRKEENN